MPTLYPYLIGKTWVFDDQPNGLKEEAFVMGMSEMITRAVESKAIANAERGFALTFSDKPFDGTDVDLHWLREDESGEPMSGNWYRGLVAGQYMEGWLCPALYCYFATAPQWIYLRVDPLPADVDPIWHINHDDPEAFRFVSADKD